VDSFPDFDPLSDEELTDLLVRLAQEERDISTKQSSAAYRRRILHGKIDITRAERARRRRRREGGAESGGSG
jgi:hypothetical protein